MYAPSIPYFKSVWKNICHYVRARRRSGFQKCALSTLYKYRVREHLNNGLVFDEQQFMFNEYIGMVMKERDAYLMRQMIAEKDPHRFLSVIVDDADEKKFGIPNFVEALKSDCGNQ